MIYICLLQEKTHLWQPGRQIIDRHGCILGKPKHPNYNDLKNFEIPSTNFCGFKVTFESWEITMD